MNMSNPQGCTTADIWAKRQEKKYDMGNEYGLILEKKNAKKMEHLAVA
jgi:hypothetical protein